MQVAGLDAVLERISGFSDRRMRSVMVTSLTRTGQDVKAAHREEIMRVVDRPTRYTQNSLYLKAATDANLFAEVGWKDDSAGSGTPATKYMSPFVEGTARGVKRFELVLQAAGSMPKGWVAVPAAGARLDAFGNMSRGQIIQILSQLGVEMTAGYRRSMPRGNSDRARKAQISAYKRAGGQFLAVLQTTGKLKPGVYQRELMGRTLTPVLIYVPRAQYARRYAFDDLSRRVASERLPVRFAQAMAESQARRMSGTVMADRGFEGFPMAWRRGR